MGQLLSAQILCRNTAQCAAVHSCSLKQILPTCGTFKAQSQGTVPFHPPQLASLVPSAVWSAAGAAPAGTAAAGLSAASIAAHLDTTHKCPGLSTIINIDQHQEQVHHITCRLSADEHAPAGGVAGAVGAAAGEAPPSAAEMASISAASLPFPLHPPRLCVECYLEGEQKLCAPG